MKETAKEKRFRGYIVELYKTIDSLKAELRDMEVKYEQARTQQ